MVKSRISKKGRKGKERKGKERKGKERKGKERKGKERKKKTESLTRQPTQRFRLHPPHHLPARPAHLQLGRHARFGSRAEGVGGRGQEGGEGWRGGWEEEVGLWFFLSFLLAFFLSVFPNTCCTTGIKMSCDCDDGDGLTC